MSITDKDIKAHSDLATDMIFGVPNAHIVKAKISRLVVDPNRAPDDIEMEYKLGHQGVVVSVSEDGKPIYKDPPTVEAIFERVKKYHDSFHKKIMELESKVKFLIDGHSMKSVAPSMKVDAGKERPDITLGNRDYTTCSREITMKIKHFFEEKKFQVRINDPYKGKYILDHHCSRKGLSGIQIEINRKFYMDEKKLLVHEEKVKKLNCMIRELVEMLVEDVFKL